MRYQKAIDLWADNNSEKLHNGELVLQTGQWVYCGKDSVKSRYVGLHGLSVWVAHGVDHKAVMARFHQLVNAQNGVTQ